MGRLEEFRGGVEFSGGKDDSWGIWESGYRLNAEALESRRVFLLWLEV